jgi:hypothetical protein
MSWRSRLENTQNHAPEDLGMSELAHKDVGKAVELIKELEQQLEDANKEIIQLRSEWKAATERAAGIAEERTYRFCCSGHGVDIAQKIRGKEGGRPVRTIKKNQSVLVARHWE